MRQLKERTARVLDIAEAAWLAGFIDGEGTIARYAAKVKFFVWVLSVSSTDRGALEYCQQITNAGGVCEKRVYPGRKPAFVWKVSAQRDLAAVLEQVLPYLKIRREQAEAFLAGWSDTDGS